MPDLRPVGYVIGLLVTILGATMVVPMAVDLIEGQGHWTAFLEASLITMTTGVAMSLACANGVKEGLTIQQTFLLTTGVWVALPIFGALPMILGATDAEFVDAFFEAMSGLTTTGSTVLVGLDDLPKGLLLWRGILQWLGGIGIIVVAMVFLPELRVGGMQIFRAEAFDTMGKILPRATEISARISSIYVGLTVLCALSYGAAGVGTFDAIVHAMTTVATGGLSTYDNSFAELPPAAEYVAVVFMLLAAMPFVRYVQFLSGTARPLFLDAQVRGFFIVLVIIVLLLTLWMMPEANGNYADTFRAVLFNTTSLMTGTGFSSENYMEWGSFPVMVLFFTGLIGGCAGSTACSIKIFRYQLLFASIRSQIQQLRSPHGLFTPRFQGRPVAHDVLSSVMSFFVFFIVTMGAVAWMLSFTGLDFITSVSGAATALANVGPGLGDEIGPAGNFGGLNDSAKWILCGAMLIGRLELMVVYTILTVRFWRV
ncbi:TrkH family potassium uptake protein [Chachezhania antarctica]|uniref:TrkH family potassium uptake protein n=1 Tax=Chachezhania antarctica TaxID=2340860 RepID=UPI000EAB6576|nr:TrkH family potassium uptake protein [Chachezhania antarctica]|tara:strand:+ start:1086 stop:2534 length:1449 start_codon:yes stop_codon:yes gene_type:complete